MRSAPTRKQVTRPREEIKHAPLKLRFAVLLGGSAPAGEVSLIEPLEGETVLRHRFAPLANLSSGRTNYCLGLLPVSDDRHVQRIRMASVHRGRVGGKKPDPLILLQATPEEFSSWPKVKREGLARAALRQGIALDAVESSPAPHWWLALEFALHGSAASTEFRALCARFEVPATLPADQAIKASGRLVATEYLERAAESARARSVRLARKNPFWQSPDPAHLRSWLEGLDWQTAGMVQEQLNKGQNPPMGANAAGPHATLTPQEHAAAEQMFERVAQIEPVLLKELQQTHASSLNVLAWLLDAHQLIASPGYGVLFELRQVLTLLAKLPPLRGEPGALPGTGELRKLGLPRRKAEALRDVLEEWPWLLDLAKAKPKPKLTRKGGAGRSTAAKPKVAKEGAAPSLSRGDAKVISNSASTAAAGRASISAQAKSGQPKGAPKPPRKRHD